MDWRDRLTSLCLATALALFLYATISSVREAKSGDKKYTPASAALVQAAYKTRH